MDCVLSGAVAASTPLLVKRLGGADGGADGGAGVDDVVVDKIQGIQGVRGAGAGPGRGTDRRLTSTVGTEVDNVGGESGEESEDEWNYYRVEPTGDKEPGPQNPDSGAEDMESQLNPNAAVFIPSSPTENSNHIEQPFNENLTQEQFFNKDNVMSSSFIAVDPSAATNSAFIEPLNVPDEICLSSSPKKGGVSLDNVPVPTEEEFDLELSLRPGDLNVENQPNTMNGDNVVLESLQNGEESLEVNVNAVKDESPGKDNLNPFAISDSPQACVGLDNDILIPEKQNESNLMDDILESPYPAEPFKFVISDATGPVKEVHANLTTEGVVEFSHPVESANIVEDDAKLLIDVEASNGNFESGRSHSPIVSSASDFGLGNVAGNKDFLNTSPFYEGISTSDLSSEPLNEGVMYSVSGFDNMMDAPSVHVAPVSPSVDQMSAQSTPFEESAFEFGVGRDCSDLQLEKQEIPSLKTEVEIHSQFQESDFIVEACVETETDLNEAFCKNSKFLAMDNETINESQTPVDIDVHEDLKLVASTIAPETFSQPTALEEELTAPPAAPENELASSPLSAEIQIDAPLDIDAHIVADTNAEILDNFEDSPVQSKLEDVKPQSPIQVQVEDFKVVPPIQSPVEDFKVVPPIQSPVEDFKVVPPTQSPVEDFKVVPPIQSPVEDFQAQSPIQSPVEDVKAQSPIQSLVEDVQAQSPVQSFDQDMQPSNDDFTFGLQNNQPVLPDLCDVPSIEEKVSPPEEKNFFVEESAPSAPQELVNGFKENVLSPDVVASAPPAPVFEDIVQIESARDLACQPSGVPAAAEVSEITVQDEVAELTITGTAPEPIETTNEQISEAAATAVAVTAGAAVAAAAAAAALKTEKKPASKAPVAKPKLSTAAKAPLKTATKPASSSSASAPKKPTAPPVPAARAARAAPKPKPAETAAAPKPSAPKPRTTAPAARTTTTDKKPLTNGDASKAPSSKPLARPATRPVTAPARTTARPSSASTAAAAKTPAAPPPARPPPIRRPTATTTSSTNAAAAAPKPKSAPTAAEPKTKPTSTPSTAARPRPATASTTSSMRSTVAASKPIDKQTKETTNKLISATRSTVPRTTTVSKTAVSKTSSTATAAAAAKTAPNKTLQGKPVPARKPAPSTGATKAAVGKKLTEKPKAMTNGVVKNGHATPDEIPVQNGVSHDEPVIEKRENDVQLELHVDNQLVA